MEAESHTVLKTPFINVSTDPLSKPALDLARSWIRQCQESHLNCEQLLKHTLPPRLVDVTGSSPRLTQSPAAGNRYVALSHCWGDEPFLSTTQGNLPDHQRGILPSSLPPSFRDAVAFTKALGLKYIWIGKSCREEVVIHPFTSY
jgi:hypothetical protein